MEKKEYVVVVRLVKEMLRQIDEMTGKECPVDGEIASCRSEVIRHALQLYFDWVKARWGVTDEELSADLNYPVRNQCAHEWHFYGYRSNDRGLEKEEIWGCQACGETRYKESLGSSFRR